MSAGRHGHQATSRRRQSGELAGDRAGRLRAGFFAADRAVQTHVGMGYAVEYQVEQ